MVFSEIPTALLIGIGFGVVGISFWVIGLYIFDRLITRYGPAEEHQEQS